MFGTTEMEEPLPLYKADPDSSDLFQKDHYKPALPHTEDYPPRYADVDADASTDPSAGGQPAWLDEQTDSLKFCKSCTDARQCPSFIKRLKTLFVPTHCSTCKTYHPNMFFSEREKAKHEDTRECIAYESVCALCPHIQLGLRDIIKGFNPDYIRHWKCAEPDCICVNAQASVQPTVAGRYDYLFSRTWSRSTQLDLSSPSVLQDFLIRPMTGWLCPHHQLQPRDLFNLRTYTVFDDRSCRERNLTRRILPCTACQSASILDMHSDPSNDVFQLSDRAREDPLRLGFFGTMQTCKLHVNEDVCTSNWYDTIDPQSYGLLEDDKWKKIVWCGDTNCPTTHGFARFGALRRLGIASIKGCSATANYHAVAHKLDAMTKSWLKQLLRRE